MDMAMEAIDLKWHEFKRAVEMQQSYLELAIKLNLFNYTIIGAIVSFYFTHTELAMAKYALGLRTAPEGILLVMICVIFGAMLVLVFVTLLWFFVHAG